jgi:hypothetical protein
MRPALGLYILDEHGSPVPCSSSDAWALWREHARRDGSLWAGRDDVGRFRISTVFLGLDHSFGVDGPPVLWETAIFDATSDDVEIVRRYTSRADAEAGHAVAVAHARHLVGTGR